jgi:serine/threonine protein kinase
MTFSDPLLRHATIKANEVFESNAIKITIPKKGSSSQRNVHEDSVQVCSMREPTTPEMVDNKGHDFSVDWWALGILLFEMISG